jgi:hypothetical protein
MDNYDKANIKNFKDICEPSEKSTSEINWSELQQLSEEIPDNDPKLTIGAHQIEYDEHTRNVIRAKNLIKARDQLASLVSMIQTSLKGK